MEKNKYRKVSSSDYEELSLLNEKIKKSKYRQKFHIQPLTGLLNDPNGFSYYNGEWHLFYQWYPFDAIHGSKAWYHTVSKDLVNFKNKGLAICPNSYEDNYGAYSGSAMQIGDKLFVFYTGNNRDDEFIRHPNQLITKFDGEKFSKKKVLITPHPDYTEHQRDPKILYKEELKKYFMLVGAQTKEKLGCIIVYESDFPDKNYKFKGELKVHGYENFGYMWECPDLINISGKDILLFSPQGIEAQKENFNNVYQNGYLVGSLDLEKLEFIPENEFIELDRGFDFYASQTANHTFEDKEYLIAWMGLPDTNYPTELENWSGSLTMVRELKLVDNKLYQYPVEAYEKLRINYKIYEDKSDILDISSPMEIEIGDINDNLLFDYIEQDGEKLFDLNYDNNSFTFTRKNPSFNNLDGQTEKRFITKINVNKINIFIDNSSIEIFINSGEYCLTSRLFPKYDTNSIRINSTNNIYVKSWELEKSIDESFVL